MAAPRARIGFLINPIAGMGGPVGLKGTDGLAEEAESKGGRARASERARACLCLLFSMKERILFLTASGSMGRSCLDGCGLDCKEVYSSPLKSSAIDTIQACQAFIAEGVDLILFCGGEGTARGVGGGVGPTPPPGIPPGGEMDSGGFFAPPPAAAALVGGVV